MDTRRSNERRNQKEVEEETEDEERNGVKVAMADEFEEDEDELNGEEIFIVDMMK